MDIEIGKKVGDACPFLVKFYGALHAEGNVLILTELMDISLESFYKKSTGMSMDMPELFISKVAWSVVSGLEYMKSMSLMHRDIKPSNILLNYGGEIKLCDFGISGIAKNSFSYTFIGCESYMAVKI